MESTRAVGPPFQKENELLSSPVCLPVYIPRRTSALYPVDDLRTYLEQDLQTPRLDKIHRHLWLAGLPRAARPLYRQRLLDRTIIITEDPNEHLVWHESRIFVKPLPEYLISYQYWEDHLEKEFQDESLRKSAYGFLLSYSWLICHRSDLTLAHSSGLLPESITWENWVKFLADFLSHVDIDSLSNVSIRYQYGELRLSRLHRIYRFSPSVFSTTNFIKGFKSESTWYRAFFARNFSWIFAVFAYLTVGLSAMQVGLGTQKLQDNHVFQQGSQRFAVASLILLAASVALIFIIWVFLFCFHFLWAMQSLKRRAH
ncbi:hypothetical protein IFM58399_03218 [Aspergillus lentulus]|uniref:Subtilisin-like serine protease n=1 Tax=Aspergillus lentulus TaxID=293939 RepID=A0ABQ1A030_ASPLE|nr:uncharacterized protein IFM58399_03218 [Aspergillus lentulus]GFF32458.1 hypothetical protein IFM58399_03218 [Aspergillus lentulus]GFF69868.1 hypothetical protein IFM47457_02495 [Aspergillus lentulus]GFF70319.1 hypothetical protein IFM60648_03142 [Aspergillus lentulus]GFG03627.1 hypothetical protein IFM61392_02904 [Aspergillus lentulus]